ncbi:MAG: hypothetical protein ACQETE_06510 [Bacteroidota bacterium]
MNSIIHQIIKNPLNGLQLGIALLLISSLGCDTSFDPLNDKHGYAFSMFGALDLHADTQWVRVMPIGEKLIPTDTSSSKVKVRLINEQTGESTPLQDSLFQFSNDAHVWNYWTDKALDPNTEYTLIASSPEIGFSRATVSIPSALPEPEVDFNPNNSSGFISGSSPDSIVVNEMTVHFQLPTPAGLGPITKLEISIMDRLIQGPQGKYSYFVNTSTLVRDKLELPEGSPIVWRHRQVLLANGSSDWPNYGDLTEEEIKIPDVVSNVENGVGYVAGVASRKVYLGDCYNSFGNPVPCSTY